MSKGLGMWLAREIMHLMPIIIYFLICFSLLHFAQSLLAQPGQIHHSTYMGAVIGAIFAGKVILIAQNLPVINSFSKRPLIYNISWKFAIYALFVLLLQIIEHLLHKLRATDNWILSYEQLILYITEPMFWGIQILVLMIFFIFTVFYELANVIGANKMMKLFFG